LFPTVKNTANDAIARHARSNYSMTLPDVGGALRHAELEPYRNAPGT
jgi:hypothetical protein